MNMMKTKDHTTDDSTHSISFSELLHVFKTGVKEGLKPPPSLLPSQWILLNAASETCGLDFPLFFVDKSPFLGLLDQEIVQYSVTVISPQRLTKCPALEKLSMWLCVLAAQSCLTLWPHGLQPTRLICAWNSPGKNTKVGGPSLLQGIPTQGLNLGLPHCRQILYQLNHQGSPKTSLKA